MLVKVELFNKVVEVRRVNYRLLSLAIVLVEVVRVVCAYAPQIGKSMGKKEFVYEDLSREWTRYHMSEHIIGMGDIGRHVGRNIDGLQGIHGRVSIGEGNQERRMLFGFCDAKHSCIAIIWLRRLT